MDNSNLNLAHYHGRRAENHCKHFRYDKAIENYRTAATFIEEAMKQVSSSEVLRSLQLQLKEHQRQVNLIKLKKIVLDKYIKELGRQRELEFGIRKPSPLESAVVKSNARDERSTGDEAIVKLLNQELEGGSENANLVGTISGSTSSLEFDDMQESSIPQLAPLELPPMLDFESFLSNRLDSNDL